jgi:hypothetical protein
MNAEANVCSGNRGERDEERERTRETNLDAREWLVANSWREL